jgi:hypothetical protein
MRLSWLLEDTAISGTARLAMAQADAMIDRGHRARIVTKGAPVPWRGSRAEWIYVDDFREYDASEEDAVVEGAVPLLLVDEEVYRPSSTDHEPLRVLLCGAYSDAISDGYGAVAHARWFHQTLDLIRVSPWAPSREEPLESVQEFHVALTTAEMTRLMHSCDVLVGVQGRLVIAEAMAAGLACVVTDEHEAALVAPKDNAVELGERLVEICSDEALRERLRGRGREAAEAWRASRMAPELERVLASWPRL